MKTVQVMVNFNPATKAIMGVYVARERTEQQAKEDCEALNPTDPKLVSWRVGVLVWSED